MFGFLSNDGFMKPGWSEFRRDPELLFSVLFHLKTQSEENLTGGGAFH